MRPKARYALIATLSALICTLGWWFFKSSSVGAGSTPAVPETSPAPLSSPQAVVAAPPKQAEDATVNLTPSAHLPSPSAVAMPSSEHLPGASAPRRLMPAPPSGPQLGDGEVAATRRMYLAHASLRTPSVADPASAENRAILQTMLTKSISRSVEESPKSNR